MATTAHLESFNQAKQTWLRNTGIFSLFLYAFFWLLDIGISRVGESLMFLLFVMMLFTNKPKFLLKEPIPYLLIAWIAFQFGVYQWSSSIFPELADKHINEARLLTNIFMFVAVAWWLGGSTKLITATLALCCIGFLIGGIFQEHGLIDEWGILLAGKRLTLGYRNWEHTSVYAAFMLIVLVTLRKRIIGYSPDRFSLLVKSLIYVALVFSATTIIGTQTRATWLGLTIALTTSIILYLSWTMHGRTTTAQKKTSSKSRTSKVLTLAAYATIGTIVIAALSSMPLIEKRLNAERQVINQVLAGETSNIKLTSIGIRIRTWETAFTWIKQRPITGWGAESRKALIQQSDFPAWFKKQFGHLHNSYIELLVSYGIIGLLFFAGLFIYIWCRAIQCWKKGIIPNDIMLFAVTWSVYWLIVNSFESYIIFSGTGNYINVIVAGVLYSYHIQANISQRPDSTTNQH